MPKAISMLQFSLQRTTCMKCSYVQNIMAIYLLHCTFKVIRTVLFSQRHVLMMLLETSSTEHSPFREADSRSVGKRFSRPSLNPDAHYLTHKIPPLDCNLNRRNSIRTLTPHSFKIHFNIITHTNRLLKRMLFRFPDENVYTFS
jgi:hypothetical protein